jgi:ribosomal protein S18 acetylase RimI-like enzyme
MSPPITIKTATYKDAEPIAHIQIAGWRASYQGIIPEAHLTNLSISDKTAFWQSILIDPVKAKEILVARRDEISSNEQSKTAPQVLGFVSFGSADGSPGSGGSAAETTTEASKKGELRAIYVDPEHLSEGIGRCLWLAAREKMVSLGYATAVVSVFAGNERAIRFYNKAGFTASQTGQTTVGSKTVGTLQLRKTL